MLWEGRRGSSNIEDRRGISGGHIAVGGGIGSLVIGLIIYLLGGNPSQVMDTGPSNAPQTQAEKQAEDKEAQFVSVVLADTEDIWSKLFSNMNKQYSNPTLVMFNDATQSGCGFANAATGPFYCPSDEKVYLDLSFFREMRDRFNAAGDFAEAYVIAHEVGHHLNGHTIRKGGSTPRLELEADEFAGFVLYKLGASLEQAQEVMKYIATAKASSTHPSRASRMLAIEHGWDKAAGASQ